MACCLSGLTGIPFPANLEAPGPDTWLVFGPCPPDDVATECRALHIHLLCRQDRRQHGLHLSALIPCVVCRSARREGGSLDKRTFTFAQIFCITSKALGLSSALHPLDRRTTIRSRVLCHRCSDGQARHQSPPIEVRVTHLMWTPWANRLIPAPWTIKF